jgi:hypothetical protein
MVLRSVRHGIFGYASKSKANITEQYIMPRVNLGTIIVTVKIGKTNPVSGLTAFDARWMGNLYAPTSQVNDGAAIFYTG